MLKTRLARRRRIAESPTTPGNAHDLHSGIKKAPEKTRVLATSIKEKIEGGEQAHDFWAQCWAMIAWEARVICSFAKFMGATLAQ